MSTEYGFKLVCLAILFKDCSDKYSKANRFYQSSQAGDEPWRRPLYIIEPEFVLEWVSVSGADKVKVAAVQDLGAKMLHPATWLISLLIASAIGE